MDNNMEIDTARSPEPHQLSPVTDPGSIPTLDGWIENLMSCKQLSENDVQRLCDRVSPSVQQSDLDVSQRTDRAHSRQEKFYRTSRTSSQWYVESLDEDATVEEQGQLMLVAEMSRYGLRRYPRPVPRFDGTFPHRRTESRYKLPLYG